jgi:predicted phage gp36 major capsid-like protein
MTKYITLAGLAGASALTLPRAIAAHGVRADASSPQAVLDELNRAFAEFRTQNDQRIAALEAGRTDPVATERVETLTRTVGELQSSLDQLTLRIEAARLSGGMSGDPRLLTPETRAYSAAFNTFFRRGEGESGLNALAVQAAMTTGTDADGGYLVPFEMEQTIDRVLMTVSAVRDLATVMTISGGSATRSSSAWAAPAPAGSARQETRTETGTPSPGRAGVHARRDLRRAEAPASSCWTTPASTWPQWLADEVSITFAEAGGRGLRHRHRPEEAPRDHGLRQGRQRLLRLGLAGLHRLRRRRRLRQLQPLAERPGRRAAGAEGRATGPTPAG